jgi:hypothetical protein
MGRAACALDCYSFFGLLAAPAPEFEADSLRLIQAGLDGDVDPRGVAAARLIQAYELMYWDTLYEAST